MALCEVTIVLMSPPFKASQQGTKRTPYRGQHLRKLTLGQKKISKIIIDLQNAP